LDQNKEGKKKNQKQAGKQHQGKIIKNAAFLVYRGKKKPQNPRSEIKLVEVKESTAFYSLSSFPVSLEI